MSPLTGQYHSVVVRDPIPAAGDPAAIHDPVLLQEVAASRAAADWNSLLIWARRQRQPYWDTTTKSYHVEHGKPAYYAGLATDAASGVRASEPLTALEPAFLESASAQQPTAPGVPTRPTSAGYGDGEGAMERQASMSTAYGYGMSGATAPSTSLHLGAARPRTPQEPLQRGR